MNAKTTDTTFKTLLRIRARTGANMESGNLIKLNWLNIRTLEGERSHARRVQSKSAKGIRIFLLG